MKAITYTRYGDPDVLQLREVARPSPQAHEALVEVAAASVNYADWAFVKGKPFLVRLMGAGLLKPQNPVLGADIAGRVAAIGVDVKDLQPGDEVIGDISECGWGGFAQYVTVPAGALAPKPANLTFEEAAAVPQAATTALQGLRDVGEIQSGQKVLINGASGGIGTFAVQIAKAYGAEVTGVCSTRNLELVRSLGADHVIDYTREDFAGNGQSYDLILATAGYRSIFDYRRALSPRGIYVMSGGAMAQLFQAMLLGAALSERGGRKLTNLAAKPSREDLLFLTELLEDGQIAPVVDRCYPLPETAEAIGYYGQGRARGKVVISVGGG